MLFGAIPALIVGVFYLAGIIALVLNLDGIVTWATPFADGWSEPLRTGLRVVAVLAVVALAALLVIFSFTAITLLVGDPFYERIWREVERRNGSEPAELGESLWAGLARGIANALRFFAVTASVGLLLFVCGFIPVIGQTVVPVIGFAVGGWFLATELTGFAFDGRGRSLADRRRSLRSRRALTLGFGVATYATFLIPGGAVLFMPSAVAGATLLARETLPANRARLA